MDKYILFKVERQEKMKAIKAASFGYYAKEGELNNEYAQWSMRTLKERTNINTIILTIVAEQANAHSTSINWQTMPPKDEEIKATIRYAQSLGLDVILKPMINCADGTWRAYINFFNIDVVCEPKWSDWFLAYRNFLLHYAKIAQEFGSTMFVVGCELVSSDHREAEWRKLIDDVRGSYKGLITYNCDKYQEDHLTWWDAVDVISSSGYYPYNQWDKELLRIEKVVKKYNKPFFFCEAGAPSVEGGDLLPNDWTNKGKVSLEAQTRFYEGMLSACAKVDFVLGFGLWDWKAQIYSAKQATNDIDYAFYNKPAEKLIKDYYGRTN
jgi:hypothetical protein